MMNVKCDTINQTRKEVVCLTLEEFIQDASEIYETYMSEENDDDYVVDPEQMKHLTDLLIFFTAMAKRHEGAVEDCNLIPRERNGGVTAYFPVFDLNADELLLYCKVMVHCSALSIDSMVDGSVCLSATVPNVFRKIEEND